MKTRMNQLPPQSDGKMQSRPLNKKILIRSKREENLTNSTVVDDAEGFGQYGTY